jgi:CheY-like chemotaxis protein
MMEDPRTISTALEIVWIAKAIERIGDHVKNIAEQVIYIVRGTDVRHISKERSASAGPDGAGHSAMDHRVLVVEDDPAIQELLRFTLRKSGLTATRDATAEEASAALNGALPDVVLIDWMLPKTSGITLARQLRAESHAPPALPIIMVTAKGEEGDRVEGLETGADDYLVKPFSPRELVARIQALLRRRAPHVSEMVLAAGPLRLDPIHLRSDPGRPRASSWRRPNSSCCAS